MSIDEQTKQQKLTSVCPVVIIDVVVVGVVVVVVVPSLQVSVSLFRQLPRLVPRFLRGESIIYNFFLGKVR